MGRLLGLTHLMSLDTMRLVKEQEPKTPLGRRLREARKAKSLGTNELNRLVILPDGKPLGSGYISKVEGGQRTEVQAEHIAAIARVLGVTQEWLLTGTGQRDTDVESSPSNKPNLEHVLAKLNRRNRWAPTTIGAARAARLDLPVSEWPVMLDGMEAALSGALKKLG